jgi:hypothetical protein
VRDLYRLALLMTFLAFLIHAAASGQETTPPSPASESAPLPDAPSLMRSTTCTENNGKPCPEWLHKLIGQYPPLPESAITQFQRDPSSVHFWTYRGWQDPPLRTTQQVFHSKLFLGAHIGGAIAMIVACRTRTSREKWHSEVPAVAAMFGMDYIQFRFVGGPNAVAPAVYEMVHYGLASTR